MPRGFLKHANGSNAGVGNKVSRGGSSRPNAKVYSRRRDLWKETSRPRRQHTLSNYCSGYHYDHDDDGEDVYEDFENENDLENDVDDFPDEDSDHSFVPVSEINSVSETSTLDYSFCEDVENSTFSIIEGSSTDAGSYSNDEDQSYVAINTCDLGCLFSVEISKKGPAAECNEPTKLTGTDQRVCSICLEGKPLLRLMKKCRCHPSACRECLRVMYIDHSLDDPHVTYPLRFFWPDCDKPLRDAQVRQFAKNQHEVEKYYRFEAKKKNQRAEERRRTNDLATRASYLNIYRTIQICPHCSHPASVQPYKTIEDTATQICCIKCPNTFQVEKLPRGELVAILVALGNRAASCPGCGAFFVKDGGCDHMTCPCGKEFSFLKQKNRLRRHRLI